MAIIACTIATFALAIPVTGETQPTKEGCKAEESDDSDSSGTA